MNDRTFYAIVGGLVLCGLVALGVAMLGDSGPHPAAPLGGEGASRAGGGVPPVPVAPVPGEAALRRDLEQARLERDALRQEAESLRQENRSLAGQVSGLRQEAQALTERLRQAEEEIARHAAVPGPVGPPPPVPTGGRPYLGVSFVDTGAPRGAGVMVEATAGGPAAAGGIRSGDIIFRFGGAAISDWDDLVRAIQATAPGQAVDVRCLRDGSEVALTVTLGRR